MNYAVYIIDNMMLTEEEIRNLPIATEEEMEDINLSKEDVIEETIRLFLEKAKKMDELYDKGLLK